MGKRSLSRANLPTRSQGDTPRGSRPRGDRRATTEALFRQNRWILAPLSSGKFVLPVSYYKCLNTSALSVGNPERHWKVPPVKRREVLRRDNHTYQYCGSIRHLTLDHVIPRSKGGQHSWDNVVTACDSCNSMKGDRLPHEVGMVLKTKPKAPFTQQLHLPNNSGVHNA